MQKEKLQQPKMFVIEALEEFNYKLNSLAINKGDRLIVYETIINEQKYIISNRNADFIPKSICKVIGEISLTMYD